jgi:integrase
VIREASPGILAREIPISERLAAELKGVRRQQLQGGVVAASDWVFRAVRGRPSEDGKRKLKVLSTRVKSIQGAWVVAKRKAGISPDFHFHDIRHTTASWLKMGGADDLTVMTLMGHSDFNMMKRYAHLTSEHKRESGFFRVPFFCGSSRNRVGKLLVIR